ncbi:MAG: hypothetical protein VX404_08360 [Planctomycetota bacterium]|nr:hypothetical protein [Planctomycetota bacterium]
MTKKPPTKRQLRSAIQDSWSLLNMEAPISIRPRDQEAGYGARYRSRTPVRFSLTVWSFLWVRIQNTTVGLEKAPAIDRL